MCVWKVKMAWHSNCTNGTGYTQPFLGYSLQCSYNKLINKNQWITLSYATLNTSDQFKLNIYWKFYVLADFKDCYDIFVVKGKNTSWREHSIGTESQHILLTH